MPSNSNAVALVSLILPLGRNSTVPRAFGRNRELVLEFFAEGGIHGFSPAERGFSRNVVEPLVVETAGFNGKTWVDTGKGHPLTEEGKVTERFTRKDFGHLDMDITIEDPKAYAKPWRVKVPVHLLPDTDLIETFCENERDSGHMK